MPQSIYHMCIDVRGLLNWTSAKRRKLFTNENGKHPTDLEVKNYLYDKLKEGYEVIPFTNVECEGFDKIKGCPGHPVNEEQNVHGSVANEAQ